MYTLILVIFIVGYLFIALEHPLKIDKTACAIITGVICWIILVFGTDSIFQTEIEPNFIHERLLHHLGEISEILFFLLGGMTIVELIDTHNGFQIITSKIKTTNRVKLFWVIGIITFVLSSVLDNLTTTIVMATLLKKLIKDKEDIWFFGGIVVIAANAGGAWSPIGDVTTTMLWIGDKVSTLKLIEYLFLPSLLCMAVPAFIASFMPAFKGEIEFDENEEDKPKSKFSGKMLFIGLGAIIFVPIFKTITHLPPYVGMMLSLGVVATFAEIFSRRKFSLTDFNTLEESNQHATHGPVHHSLSKIEMPSILFFLGILMAVAALESLGILFNFATTLKQTVPMLGTELHGEGVSDLVVMLLGVGSAVIDNVPLVAASLGMFSEPLDNELWHFIAFAAGTGGSMLIIGSAAGVVAMGMEKIDFFWYLKNIAWLALIGFVVGSATFMVTRTLF